MDVENPSESDTNIRPPLSLKLSVNAVSRKFPTSLVRKLQLNSKRLIISTFILKKIKNRCFINSISLITN